jgi:hypothetical protein
MENTEASTATANGESAVLVLKDAAGSYFLLPQGTLEQGRVPEEQKAEMERLIAERDDVQGHIFPTLVAAFVIANALVGVSYGIAVALEDEPGTMTNAQFVQQVIDQGRR